MTNIGICGLGNIGRVHLDNLRSLRGCRVTTLFDTREEILSELASSSGARACSSLEEMVRDDRLDAVVVATPEASHRSIAVAALHAGKHVFIEKPIAGTMEDARAIVEAANETDRVAQAGFCERFNPNFIEARRAVLAGQLGELRFIESSRVAPYGMSNPAWTLGALDTAVHNFDLITWMMGRLPTSVTSRGVQIYANSAIPHAIHSVLSFEDGALAADTIAWIDDSGHPLNQCARPRMRLIGSAGFFDVDLTTRPSAMLTGGEYRMPDSVILGGPEYYGCLKLQFEGFLRSIEDGTPVLCPLEDAYRTELVALAAKRSLETGREAEVANP